MTDPSLIPLFSLGVALLAVIVGPTISLLVARKQMATSLEVARLQSLGPVGQVWARELSDALAEFFALSLHYFKAGFEDRNEAEYQRLTLLEYKAVLLLDPNDVDHETLIGCIRVLGETLGDTQDPTTRTRFATAHVDGMKSSRKVLLEYVSKVQRGYVEDFWEDRVKTLPPHWLKKP